MSKAFSAGICFIILLVAIGAAGAISITNLAKLNIAETGLWDPALSPDGTKIAYIAYDDTHNQQVFVINIDGTGERKLTDDVYKKWGIAWGPNKIAYVSFGKDGLEKIFVVNPDGTGNMQLIPDNTRQGNSAEDKPPVWSAPSWSPDGMSLVYTSLDETANQKIYMVNADGTGKRLVLNDTSRQWSPEFSMDGKSIVYVSYNERFREELFIVDAAGTAKRQLTFDEIKKNNPVWGPEGTIVYISYENLTSSSEKLFAIDQNGTNKRLFVDSDYRQRSPTFSRDGRKFAYAAIDSSGEVKIALGDVAGATATAIAIMPTSLAATTTMIVSTGTPIGGEAPAGMENVLWTMFLVLGIIVIVLLALLVIANFLK